MDENIRILIADDHSIVREGLKALIATEPGIELVGEAADGIEAVAKTLTLEPDVILLDLVMPRQNGLEVIHQLRKHKSQTRILVLTSYTDNGKVFSAIRAGALGYLLKDSAPHELLRAIREVYHGAPALHPTVLEKLMREFDRDGDNLHDEEELTSREVDIIKLLSQGLSNQEIADKLFISERTVRTHVSNILMKLNLTNRTQLALYALKNGLATLEPT